MTTLLEHLGRDTLPPAVIDAFVQWCVWQQAHPALLTVLRQTNLTEAAEQVEAAKTYAELQRVTALIGADVHAMRTRTGPLGLSAAEASSFLVSKMAAAATESDWDPEGVAFFAAQMQGWAAWAETNFVDAARKPAGEQRARQQQEAMLSELYRMSESGSLS
jgi:hypothetical protein